MADRETEKRIYARRKARVEEYQKIVEEQLSWDGVDMKQFLSDMNAAKNNSEIKPSLNNVKSTQNPNLTVLQELFVENFLRYRNGTRAASIAGYKDPDKASQVLLYYYPHVKEEIQRRLALVEKRNEFQTDKIIKELANIAFSNLDDFLELDSNGQPVLTFKWASREQLAALREIHNETLIPSGGDEKPVVRKTQIRMHDKIRALEILAKLFNLYPEDKPAEGARMAGAIMAALREMKQVEGV